MADLQSIGGVNLQGVFTQDTFYTLIFWATFVLGLLFIGFLSWSIVWYSTYKVRVRYYEKLGLDKKGMRLIGQDRGKLVKDHDGVHKLRLFWKRKKIEPPKQEAYMPTKRGKELYMITNGIDFEPIALSSNPGFVEVEMHKRLWLSLTYRQALEQYSKPSFWEKYGNYIMTILTVFICIGGLIFTVWLVKDIAFEAIHAFAPAIRESGRSLIPAIPGA